MFDQKKRISVLKWSDSQPPVDVDCTAWCCIITVAALGKTSPSLKKGCKNLYLWPLTVVGTTVSLSSLLSFVCQKEEREWLYKIQYHNSNWVIIRICRTWITKLGTVANNYFIKIVNPKSQWHSLWNTEIKVYKVTSSIPQKRVFTENC